MIRLIFLFGIFMISHPSFAEENKKTEKASVSSTPKVYLVTKCKKGYYEEGVKLIHQFYKHHEGISKTRVAERIKRSNNAKTEVDKLSNESIEALKILSSEENYCYLLKEGSGYGSDGEKLISADANVYRGEESLYVLAVWDTPKHEIEIDVESNGTEVDCEKFYMDCWEKKKGKISVKKVKKFKTEKMNKFVFVDLFPDFTGGTNQLDPVMNIVVKENDEVIFERKNFHLRWRFIP